MDPEISMPLACMEPLRTMPGTLRAQIIETMDKYDAAVRYYFLELH